MVGHQWLPWINNPSPGTNAMTPAKQEREISPDCPHTKKPAMGHQLGTVVGLSTLCFVLLVACIALAILYNHESDNKPEWNNLLFDYQNISDHYLTVAKANNELKRDNQNLKEHNSWLDEQTRLLNRSFAKLTSMNRALTLEGTQLQQQIANLTSTNLQLSLDHDQLVQYSSEQEEKKLNMSQSISDLINSQTQLEEERQRLSETNTFLREELFQVKENNRELLELNNKLQGEIQSLDEKIEADAFLRDDCEKASKDNTQLQETVAELQQQKQNLSALLGQERRDAAERERSRREEMDLMLVDMRSMNEAYHSLDRYCPVVNQKTNERICKKCHDSWKLFQTKCYYFSSRTLAWRSSRAWCQTQGGDLLIINSQQEQTFIFGTSQAMEQASTRVWIGMTDAEMEGEWHWVDGSPVTSDQQYWLSGAGRATEPDDWKLDNPLGEDCGHIDSSESELTSWMDGSCDVPYRWICEKNV
ncbi:uncharacterized protein LOC144542971 [Centroberyx gerrardi]